MRNKKVLGFGMLVGLVGCFSATNVFAEDANMQAPTVCAPINEKLVGDLFDTWNNALQTKNPDQVVANYADNGVLLPTISNTPRTTHAEMRAYFVDFLKKSPVGHIDQRVIRFGCNWATDTGIYTFTLKDNGKTQKVEARYSYVYENIGGKWLIINHHSSMMPEVKKHDVDF